MADALLCCKFLSSIEYSASHVVKQQRPPHRSSFVCSDEHFPKSGGSNIDLLSPLTSPLLLDMVGKMPLRKRFWSVNAGLVGGYWESHVHGSWIHRGVEDEKFRMRKYVFNQLHQKYRDDFEKRGDVRVPIGGKKRLAILLHWIAPAPSRYCSTFTFPRSVRDTFFLGLLSSSELSESAS